MQNKTFSALVSEKKKTNKTRLLSETGAEFASFS